VRCQECGLPADERAHRWRAYRTDLVDDQPDHPPTLVFYCGECAVREFGPTRSAVRRVGRSHPAAPALELRPRRSPSDGPAAETEHLYVHRMISATAEVEARGVLPTASFLVLIAFIYLAIGFALGKWV